MTQIIQIAPSKRPATSAEARAIELVRQFRRDGIDVARVVLEGRRIEIEIAQKGAPQKIDQVKW